MIDEEIKQQLEEIAKKLNGELTFHICTNKFSAHQKIEIVYDRQKR